MEENITIKIANGDGEVCDSLEVPVANDKPQSEKKPKTYLDESLIWDLHNVIESSDIFMREEPLKHKYNLFCAFKDRMFSAVKYLNEHSKPPKTEEEFINFLVYAAIVRDGIMKLYENLYGEKPPFIEEKKYFLDVRTYSEKYFSEETQPTDDDFFEYIRAMAFAHPYETSKRGRPFLQGGEIQMCPWVIIGRPLFSQGIKNPVGIRIYSNKFEDSLLDILFSFDDVAADLGDKLVRRHPHVFGDAKAYDSHDVLKIWQQVKTKEKKARTVGGLFDGIPPQLSALRYAYDVAKKADYGILEKADKNSVSAGDSADMGRRLFELVREAASRGLEPEAALRDYLNLVRKADENS